jgi:ketosteroid isomerase-like protein
MSEESVETVRRLFDAYNDRDVDALREVWTSDAEWRPAQVGGAFEGAVYHGHEGLAEYREIQDETWKSFVADPVTIRDLGDRVLVEVQANAVGRASDVPVNRIIWTVFEMRDGKVAAGRVYGSKADALEAAGLEE